MAKKRNTKPPRGPSPSEVTKGILSSTQTALNYGIRGIIEVSPRLEHQATYISKHVDQQAVFDYIEEAVSKAYKPGMSFQDVRKIYQGAIDGAARKIVSGDFIDDRGKRVILKSGLEKKATAGFWGKVPFVRGKRKELASGKYLDKTIRAFNDLAELFESGKYSERLADVKQAVDTVRDMGFLDTAADILGDYKIVNNKNYWALKEAIQGRTKYEAGNVVEGIKKYATEYKVAASILGVAGLGILFFSGRQITGNVVSNSAGIAPAVGFFVGLAFLFASFLFFAKVSRNKKKERYMKRGRL